MNAPEFASAPSSLSCEEAGATSRRLLACALLFAALAALALAIDLPVRKAMQEAGSLDIPGDIRRLLTLSEVFAHGFGVLACIAVAVTLDRRGWRIGPRLLIGAFGAGLLADLCKLQVARFRPKHAPADLTRVADTFLALLPWRAPAELGIPLNNSLRSFPSGHTATAVGLAIVLSMLYPRGRWLFALFAVLAGLQRIESGMHYVSDTLAAAALAFLVGAGVCGRTRLSGWLQRIERGPRDDGALAGPVSLGTALPPGATLKRAG